VRPAFLGSNAGPGLSFGSASTSLQKTRTSCFVRVRYTFAATHTLMIYAQNCDMHMDERCLFPCMYMDADTYIRKYECSCAHAFNDSCCYGCAQTFKTPHEVSSRCVRHALVRRQLHTHKIKTHGTSWSCVRCNVRVRAEIPHLP